LWSVVVVTANESSSGIDVDSSDLNIQFDQ